RLGVLGVERVLRVHEGCDAARALRVRDRVEGEGRLSGRFRSVDLDDAAAGKTADAERHIERDGSRGNHLDRSALVTAEAHDGALAELTVDLRERGLEGLLAICWCRHCNSLREVSMVACHRLSLRRGPMVQGPQPPDKAGWCFSWYDAHATLADRH